MQILYELVTVIREQRPRYHWETGKMADAMIYKPGDLPDVMYASESLTPRVIGCTYTLSFLR